jgi:hypothetical protein
VLTEEAAGPLLAQWQNFYVIAGATLLLLFDGIHNSWDTVTYVAVGHGQRSKKGPGDRPKEQSSERS